MIVDMVRQQFADLEDKNCADRILRGANAALKLGIPEDCLQMASGFGGGATVGSLCGALAAGVMVLSFMVPEREEHGARLKALVQEFLEAYRKDMGHWDCHYLKDRHRTEEEGCRLVIERAAEELDRIVKREWNNAEGLAESRKPENC